MMSVLVVYIGCIGCVYISSSTGINGGRSSSFSCGRGGVADLCGDDTLTGSDGTELVVFIFILCVSCYVTVGGVVLARRPSSN